MTKPSEQEPTEVVMAFVRPPRRIYKDRMGQVITDPATIEARWLQDHIGRAETRRCKAGQGGDPTVGEVAQAIGLTPERVVEIVREWDVWLWGLVENDGPVATWGIFLDGE